MKRSYVFGLRKEIINFFTWKILLNMLFSLILISCCSYQVCVAVAALVIRCFYKFTWFKDQPVVKAYGASVVARSDKTENGPTFSKDDVLLSCLSSLSQ